METQVQDNANEDHEFMHVDLEGGVNILLLGIQVCLVDNILQEGHGKHVLEVLKRPPQSMRGRVDKGRHWRVVDACFL